MSRMPCPIRKQKPAGVLQAVALMVGLLLGTAGGAPAQTLPSAPSATGQQAWVFDAAVYNQAQEERARRLHQVLTRQNTYDACTHFSSSFAAAALSGNGKPPPEVQARSIRDPDDALKLMVNAFRDELPASQGFEINADSGLTPVDVIREVANALDENRAVILGIDSTTLYEAFFQRPETQNASIAHAVMVSGVNRGQNGEVRGFYFLDSSTGMSYFANVWVVMKALANYRQLNDGKQALYYVKSRHPIAQPLAGRFHSLRLVNLDRDWIENDALLCFQSSAGRLTGNLFQRSTTPLQGGGPQLLRQDYIGAALEAQHLRALDQPLVVAGQDSAYCPELNLAQSPLSKFEVQDRALSAGPFAETRFRVLKDASGSRCPADRIQKTSRERHFSGQDRQQCQPMGSDTFQIDGRAFDKLGIKVLPVFGRPAYCSDTGKTLLGWTVHAKTVAANHKDYSANSKAFANAYPLLPMRGYACFLPDAVLSDAFVMDLARFFPDFRRHLGNWKTKAPLGSYTKPENSPPLAIAAYNTGNSAHLVEQEATIAYAALRDLYEQGGSRQDYQDYRSKWAIALETQLRMLGVDIYRLRGHELLLLHFKYARAKAGPSWEQTMVSPLEAENGIYYLAHSAAGANGNPLSRQDLSSLGIEADWSKPLYLNEVSAPQFTLP